MIELLELTKTYIVDGKKFQGLKGITLNIAKGEFVSIMGPSGSGKSTLSSILGCLAAPSSGVYKIAGKIVTDLNPNELADLRNKLIGFVFQDFNLLDGVSVIDNVALPLIYARVPLIERRKRAMGRLEQMGLAHKAKNFPNQLSGGQKQRVAIARALVTNPKLIFADEPTGALDKKTGNDIMGILQDLNRDGQTVVQVTHSVEHGNYGKRIVYIVDGLIIRDELVARPTLAKGIDVEENGKDTDLIKKLWQVRALAPRDDEAVTDAMEYLIHQKNSTTSFMEAAKALAPRTGTKAETLILALLNSPEAVVRAETVRQLEKGALEFAVPQWWKAVTDESGWVRFAAVMMLRRHLTLWSDEDKAKFAGLISDSDERVRATIVGKIGGWKDPEFDSCLCQAFTDHDARVRANVLEAFIMMETKLTSEAQKCFEMGLQDTNNRVRANAVVGYFPFRAKPSLETLLKMLNDKNNLMRASAAWAVGRLPLTDGVEVLLEKLLSEKNDLVLSQIINTLGMSTHKNMSLKQQIEKCLSLTEQNLLKAQTKRAA